MHAPHEPRLARVAALMADAARSRMLAYLLAGHYASAGELARAASISASTASGHLAQLSAGGLLVCEARGRHRYYKLADAEVAHALQALALVAERHAHEHAWSAPARRRLRFARCCYGHLAGRLGVALLDALQSTGRLTAVDGRYALTTDGQAWLESVGLERAPARRGGTAAGPIDAGYPCLDWSERRDHLAGPLATRLLAHFIAQGWLAPIAARGPAPASRALRLTPSGRNALGSLLGSAIDLG